MANAGITRDLILTVSGKTASLSEQCYIYRGDRGITLNITIQQYKFKFNKKILNNVISSDTSIAYARAIVHKPWVVKKLEEDPTTPEHGHIIGENGIPKGTWKTEDIHGTPDDKTDDIEVFYPDYNIFDGKEEGSKVGCFEIPIVHLLNDMIEIPITADWVDELDEVGTYRLQIQLYGHEAEHQRITIPPVEFYVEEPMCDYPESGFDKLDKADYAAVDYVQLRQTGGQWYADFAGGQYKLLPWVRGEIITSERLNKIEYALQYTIEKGLPGKSDKDHDHATTFKNITSQKLQDTINQIQWEYDAQIRGLRTELINEMETKDNEVTRYVNEVKDDLREADTALRTEMFKEINELIEADKSWASSTLKDAKTYTDEEITKVDAKVTTNTNNIATNAANIDKNATNISANSTSISTNATNIEKNKNRIEEVNTALNKRIDDTNTALDTAKTELTNSINTVQTNLDTAKTELTNSINTVQTNLDNAKTELRDYIDDEIDKTEEYADSVASQALSDSKTYTDDKTKFMLNSESCRQVEFVEEYPDKLDDGVLYILIEEVK